MHSKVTSLLLSHLFLDMVKLQQEDLNLVQGIIEDCNMSWGSLRSFKLDLKDLHLVSAMVLYKGTCSYSV